MEMESCVPPGFRFHPTEEELVGYYLKRKINALKIDLDVIIDIDLYKIEPWDIQVRCKLGYSEQNEWYFFSHKDKKYPTGTRTNRATAAGFWKATGRDKAVLSKTRIIGMRKTLVFYNGRAPNGRKTDWIMHEYRLQNSEHAPPQEEGWVVCRAFRKPSPSHLQRPDFNPWNNNHTYYPNNNNNNTNYPNNNYNNNQATSSNFHNCFASAQELVSNNNNPNFSDVQSGHHHEVLPQLDSPSSVSASFGANSETFHQNGNERNNNQQSQYIDWKNLDDLLASQMEYPVPNNFSGAHDLASMSISPQSNYIQQEEAQGQHFLGCFPDL